MSNDDRDIRRLIDQTRAAWNELSDGSDFEYLLASAVMNAAMAGGMAGAAQILRDRATALRAESEGWDPPIRAAAMCAWTELEQQAKLIDDAAQKLIRIPIGG